MLPNTVAASFVPPSVLPSVPLFAGLYLSEKWLRFNDILWDASHWEACISPDDLFLYTKTASNNLQKQWHM